MKVVWTSAALADVAAISAYIDAFGPRAAQRIAAELLLTGDSLTVFPERGRPGLEPGTRELVAVRPYLIVYRVEADAGTVAILRVMHGARHRGPGGTLQ